LPETRAGGESERAFGVLSLSAAIHVFLFVGLGFSPAADGASLSGVLDFEVLQAKEPEIPDEEAEEEEEKPEPEEPEPPEPRNTPPRPRAARKPASTPVEQPPADPDRPEPSAEPEPVDFPGFTLTAEGGQSSWSTVVGSGAPIRAPVVVPKPRKKAAVTGPAAGGNPGPSRSKRNLARPPRQPPDMDETLLQYYPKQAKIQGIEGLAVMKVRISRTGEASDIRLVRESYGGFGDACEKTLRSSRWKPKLDDRGRPVPVEITYTCRFEVGY
jgi:TonB family protein